MSKPSRLSLSTVTVAVILLVAAVTAIVCDATDDWNLFTPVALICLGIYIIAVGAWKGRRSTERVVRSEGSFTMFWGNLCAVVGAVILVNYWYPDNVLYIVIAFIVWLALALLLFGMKPKVPY
jgi:peptidoglycan/LPS O-acetylase OafA/YrhL